MNGAKLKEIRVLSNKSQKDFYAHIDTKDSYGSMVEHLYYHRQIPKRLEAKVMKRYGKLLKEV